MRRGVVSVTGLAVVALVQMIAPFYEVYWHLWHTACFAADPPYTGASRDIRHRPCRVAYQVTTAHALYRGARLRPRQSTPRAACLGSTSASSCC